MTDITVQSLSEEINTPVNVLLKQFAAAGILKSANDYVTQYEQKILFSYLKKKYDYKISQSKIIIQRKIRSSLNIATSDNETNKSVTIEVRKNHHYTKINVHKEPSKLRETTKPSNSRRQQIMQSNNLKDDVTATTKKKLIKPVTDKSLEKIKVMNQDNDTNKINEPIIVPLNKIKNKEKSKHYVKKNNLHKKTKELRLAKDNVSDWENIEDHLNYHVTTSKHARQAEDEIDQAAEHMRNNLNKVIRNKKNKKHIEEKHDREEAKAAIKLHKNNKYRKFKVVKQNLNKPIKNVVRNIQIGATITVAELANKMAVKSSEVIKLLMNMGVLATINQVIDQETAQLVAEEMGHKVILRNENALEQAIMSERNITNNTEAKPRAPVVTIMGHVDHGKTSLLDYIRSTKVASIEAGGITQRIGAYHVKVENSMITFIDTPGHAAFTAMRVRGVQATDIIVLVVAADDGVMPQTIEAIQHAQAAKVPVVVAINKIDKMEANIDRVKQELTKHGIVPEEWGGENIFVNVSAKVGTGINLLLQSILLQSECLELTAVHSGMASGVVIESFLDKGRGPVATILVRSGMLNKGDIVLCGLEYGRIKAMRNDLGQEIFSAGPSLPVEILGLSGIALAGDEVTVVKDEKKAREVALYRQVKFREIKLAKKQKSSLENMFSSISIEKNSQLNVVVKADTQGTLEAISDALINIANNDKVTIKIIGSGVGAITETDVSLAAASRALIIGFNVRADAAARLIIETENLTLRYYSVIYHLINEVKILMSGMLAPEYKQQIIGLAEVRDVFQSTNKFSTIAGCMVIDGLIKKSHPIRIIRNNIVIYEGTLESLRRFKEDINEVRDGMECGIGIKNYKDVRKGDIIEVFKTIEIKHEVN